VTFDLIAAAPLPIRLHLGSALLALLLASWQLLAPKGGPLHRLRGALWVGLMVAVCVGSFAIRTLLPRGPFEGYSPVHLLSVYVLIQLGRALLALHQGDFIRHGRVMRGTYVGGLLVAGAFTLVPGRLLFRSVLGS
jgi:uncharacterized membrane protein